MAKDPSADSEGLVYLTQANGRAISAWVTSGSEAQIRFSVSEKRDGKTVRSPHFRIEDLPQLIRLAKTVQRDLSQDQQVDRSH